MRHDQPSKRRKELDLARVGRNAVLIGGVGGVYGFHAGMRELTSSMKKAIENTPREEILNSAKYKEMLRHVTENKPELLNDPKFGDKLVDYTRNMMAYDRAGGVQGVMKSVAKGSAKALGLAAGAYALVQAGRAMSRGSEIYHNKSASSAVLPQAASTAVVSTRLAAGRTTRRLARAPIRPRHQVNSPPPGPPVTQATAPSIQVAATAPPTSAGAPALSTSLK